LAVFVVVNKDFLYFLL